MHKISIIMENFSILMQAIGSFLAFLLVHKLVRKMIIGHWRRKSDLQGTKEPPEAPGAWPVIGHLQLLGGQVAPCRTLGALADQHGPIFAIRLGSRKANVVSSWEVIKECFTTNDQIFLTHPKFSASNYLGYGAALFGFSPYGPYWREIRKIAILELLSNRRLDLLADGRASELQSCIKQLYSVCVKSADGSAKADMSRWLSSVTMNTMVRMVAGKTSEDDYDNVKSQRFVKAIKGYMYLSGVFVASDFIPYTKWIDFGGYVRSMKSNAKDSDKILNDWLQEHLQRRKDGYEKDRDFIDAMISLFGDHNIDASNMYGHKSENVIKATALQRTPYPICTPHPSASSSLRLILTFSSEYLQHEKLNELTPRPKCSYHCAISFRST